VCTQTNSKVIIKAYHKSKMQPKHHHKLAREIATMKVTPTSCSPACHGSSWAQLPAARSARSAAAGAGAGS